MAEAGPAKAEGGPLRAEGVKDKREAILEAALIVFGQKGYHEATIDEIAEKAGVGKGTIYSYFSGKSALVEELLKVSSTLHLEEVKRLVSAVDGAEERLRLLTEYELAFVKRHVPLARFLVDDDTLGLSPQFKELKREGYKKYRAYIAEIVAEGQREGVFDTAIDPNVAGSMIIGLRTKVLGDFVVNRSTNDLDGLKEQVMRFMLGGLRAR